MFKCASVYSDRVAPNITQYSMSTIFTIPIPILVNRYKVLLVTLAIIGAIDCGLLGTPVNGLLAAGNGRSGGE